MPLLNGGYAKNHLQRQRIAMALYNEKLIHEQGVGQSCL